MTEQQSNEKVWTFEGTETPKIWALRLMHVREDREAARPARIVAQVDVSCGDRFKSRMLEREMPGTGAAARISPGLWRSIEMALHPLLVADLDDRSATASLVKHQKAQVRKGYAAHLKQHRSHNRSLAYRIWRAVRRNGRRAVNRLKGAEPSDRVGFAQIRLVFRTLEELLVAGKSGEPSKLSLAEFYRDSLEEVSRYAVVPEPSAPENEGEPANTFTDAPYIEPLPKDGTKGHLLEREALRYGFSSVRFPNGAFVVSDRDGNRLNFKWGRSPIASGVALSICSYKETTRRLLARAGIPVAEGRVFSPKNLELAVEYADHIGYPVVCKPVAGLRGIGVITDIKNRDELEDALKLYRKSELGNDDFVIEEQVPGEDYRIVIIGGEVVASVVREPASVVGDGLHTVADLIEYKNRARKKNPHLSTRLIPISDSVEYQLAHSGFTYDYIPEPGQKIVVANSANLTQGGDSFEITEELHPSIKELAVRAVDAVPGLGFCGLDMLIEDHTKPVDEQRVTVIELNAHAAIGSAQYPMWGRPSNVANTFFKATAAFHGITLPAKRLDRLALDLTVKGRVTGVGYRWWLKHLADGFGVQGYVENVNGRTVHAHIEGEAEAVTALGYAASRGPRRALVSSATMKHVPFENSPSFDIRGPERTAREMVKELLRR